MQEIRCIKRKDLDESKYSQALNDSLNYRIYAESWYLDIVSNGKWECLVYGDYEVIMPIPLQFKFGFKFVIQPPYCQQLGVFYKEEISPDLFRKFEQKLHQYRVRSYHFNEENTISYQPKGEKRVNFVLDLNRPYEEIYKGFSKGTKWNLKQFEKQNDEVIQNEISIEKLNLLNKKINKQSPHDKLFIKSLKILKQENKLCFLSLILNDNYEGYACFVSSKKRIIYLHAAAGDWGKQNGIPTGFLNSIIKKNSGKNMKLDFEGSMIPSIQKFFKGFNGEPKIYIQFKNFR